MRGKKTKTDLVNTHQVDKTINNPALFLYPSVYCPV